MNECSNHSESRSSSDPGASRQRTQNVLSTPSRREKSSTDRFNYIEKESGRVKRTSVGGSLQGVGRHRQRYLDAFTVAHDAQVNDLARLKIAHAVLEIEKVRHPRSVDTDDHVVALADLHDIDQRYQKNRSLPERNHRADYRRTLNRVVHHVSVGLQSGRGGGTAFLDLRDEQAVCLLAGFERAPCFTQLHS